MRLPKAFTIGVSTVWDPFGVLELSSEGFGCRIDKIEGCKIQA